MIPNLPELTFIDLTSVIHHEKHDSQRTPPLIERIRQDGLFRNPPIVTPLSDGTGRYMVLDGANRITALRELGFPHVLAQLVQPNDPGLVLENWNHVVWELDAKDLISGIRELPNANLVSEDNVEIQPDLQGDCGVALVMISRGDLYSVCAPVEDLEKRVELLNDIVDSYKESAQLDRTGMRDIQAISGLYSHLAGLVIFPHFEIQDVLRLASAGYLLPSGITRFTISPRALHVNYPLYELAADKSLEEKNADLKEWVQKRISAKGVRYYEEATFLFDE